MFNWLKRLFTWKNNMIEIKLSKEYLDSIGQTRIKIDEFRKRCRKMVNDNYSFVERLKRENERSEQLRKVNEMDKEIYPGESFWYKSPEPKEIEDEIEFGHIYQNVVNKYLVVVIQKQYKHADNFKLTLKITGIKSKDIPNNYYGWEKEITEVDFRKKYIPYNPSQERKEMEQYKCNFANVVVNLINDDGFFVNYESGKEYYTATCDDFKSKFKPLNKPEPRTLKLEDLNKLWIGSGKGNYFDGKIVSVRLDLNEVYVSRQGDGGSRYKIDYFFDHFREATQSDVDNLTKGN